MNCQSLITTPSFLTFFSQKHPLDTLPIYKFKFTNRKIMADVIAFLEFGVQYQQIPVGMKEKFVKYLRVFFTQILGFEYSKVEYKKEFLT